MNPTKKHVEALTHVLKGFDSTWGTKNVVCRRDKMRIIWNWKCQSRWVVQCGGLRVVPRWGQGGGGVLGWVVLVGCPW